MNNFTIAIVGRPNVGKSTLFNRFVGKKQSIVSDVEGVTRDRVYGRLEWLNNKYNVIDTGGYLSNSKDIIEQQVKIQADIASNESDLILFVVDGKQDITLNDRILSDKIKKLNKEVILVVNKVDTKKNEDNLYYFYELGFKHIVYISSQSGRQVGLLLDEIVSLMPKDSSKNKFSDYISFAIAGMPNVGKSSLMNKLLKSNKSIVTDIAGTTRDAIDSYIKYYNKFFRIIDTAGLRKKAKIDDSIEFYSSVRTFNIIDSCDVAAVLVDASKGFTNQDKNIMRYVIDKGKGLLVVVNKWDLIVSKETNTMKNIQDDMILSYSNLQHYPIHFISVEHNLKIGDILKNILHIYKKRKDKISTSKLNIFLEKIVKHYPPPSTKGKDVKLNYMTQILTAPPRFCLFTNHPDLISESYRRYLDNQIRKEFDFFGVPIRISIRKK